MARRKRANKVVQDGASAFGQRADHKDNIALQATRGMSGKGGDMGEPAIVGSYRRKKMVAGGSLNFARRGRGRKYGAQRPAVANRQYQQSPLQRPYA